MTTPKNKKQFTFYQNLFPTEPPEPGNRLNKNKHKTPNTQKPTPPEKNNNNYFLGVVVLAVDTISTQQKLQNTT